MNKVIFMGRIAKDLTTTTTNAGSVICKFSIAVNRRFKQEGQPDADFFNVTAFGKTAEFLSKYFTKGQQVLLEGRLQTSSWEKDGVKHYGTDMIAENVEFADSKKTSTAETGDNEPNFPVAEDNDLPF